MPKVWIQTRSTDFAEEPRIIFLYDIFVNNMLNAEELKQSLTETKQKISTIEDEIQSLESQKQEVQSKIQMLENEV